MSETYLHNKAEPLARYMFEKEKHHIYLSVSNIVNVMPCANWGIKLNIMRLYI